jgi:hypothetical protein
MQVVLGIVLLTLGAGYPIGVLFWLNRRMARQPALTPRQVGLILAFNGILPVAVILGGVACLVPGLWERAEFKAAAGAAVVAALVLLGLLLAARRSASAATSGRAEGPSADGG